MPFYEHNLSLYKKVYNLCCDNNRKLHCQKTLAMQVIKQILLIFLLFLLQTTPVSAQTYSDAELAGLMKNLKYPEAARLAAARLKALPSSDNPKRLYYLNKLGLSQFRMGNFESAYSIGRLAIELSGHTHDSALISESWQLMAYAYNRKGRFDSAVFFSRKLLDYAIRNHDKVRQGNALTSLSTILMQNGRYREALKYNLEAHSIYRKLADSSSQAASEYNIGLAYLNLKNPDSSLLYLYESLRTNMNNHGELKVYTLSAIADCYQLKKNIPLWKDYQLKTTEEAEKADNQQFVAMGFSQLSQQALANNDVKTAYGYLMKAREALTRQPYPVLQIEVDSMLYIATRKMNRYAEALKWYESFTTLQKKIFTKKQAESLNQMLVENETQKKNLLLLQKELELSRVKRSLSYLIIGAVFILLFAAVLLIYLVRVSRYRNRLFLKNKELDQQLQIARSRFELSFSEKQTDEEVAESDPDIMPDGDENQRSLLLYSRLLDQLESEKLYLDPELNVKTLQNKLGTNKKYLYEAISQFSGTNFRGLVNRYRINEVRQLMEESVGKEESISLNNIALACGFNSDTSFYRIFRQYTGLTPNEYAQEVKRELRKKKPRTIDSERI